MQMCNLSSGARNTCPRSFFPCAQSGLNERVNPREELQSSARRRRLPPRPSGPFLRLPPPHSTPHPSAVGDSSFKHLVLPAAEEGKPPNVTVIITAGPIELWGQCTAQRRHCARTREKQWKNKTLCLFYAENELGVTRQGQKTWCDVQSLEGFMFCILNDRLERVVVHSCRNPRCPLCGNDHRSKPSGNLKRSPKESFKSNGDSSNQNKNVRSPLDYLPAAWALRTSIIHV